MKDLRFAWTHGTTITVPLLALSLAGPCTMGVYPSSRTSRRITRKGKRR